MAIFNSQLLNYRRVYIYLILFHGLLDGLFQDHWIIGSFPFWLFRECGLQSLRRRRSGNQEPPASKVDHDEADVLLNMLGSILLDFSPLTLRWNFMIFFIYRDLDVDVSFSVKKIVNLDHRRCPTWSTP